MPNAEHYRKLEALYRSAPINAFYEPAIEVSEGAARIEITARSAFWHAAHAVHGSVYFKALDDAAFFAANSLIDDAFVLTVSFHVHFLRPLTTGLMTATGRVLMSSRRLMVAEATLVDDDGRDIGRGSGTFARSRIALTSDVGYC